METVAETSGRVRIITGCCGPPEVEHCNFGWHQFARVYHDFSQGIMGAGLGEDDGTDVGGQF